MKNKELFSFILVYFAILAFVNCSETVEVKKNETIVIPTAEIKANLTTSTTPNITVSSSTTTTTTVAPETEKPKKITGKKFAPTTLPPPTNTTLAPVPIKQNSTTNAQIFTEGGPINVPGVKENSTAQVSTTNSSSTNTSSSSTTLSTTTTKATSTTTTTTTTTSTTTTTTTPKPKKPTITFSDEEQPDVVPNEKSTTNHNNGLPVPSNHEVEEPHAQPSKEQFNPHRDFVVPLVTFIFALPIFLGIAVIGYRKVRDYWSTRHYRRMDFLVDGMYND